jgi:hypothetical protein
MTSIDLPAAIWHGGAQGFEYPQLHGVVSQDIGMAPNPCWFGAILVWAWWLAGGLLVAGGVKVQFAGRGVDDTDA